MTDWIDSDSYEDCGYGQPSEFDFYDPRDYETGWEWMCVEEADEYWLADHLHEDGELYVKDAFGSEFAPVTLHGGGHCWPD